MTIPYNAQIPTIVNYLKEALVLVDKTTIIKKVRVPIEGQVKIKEKRIKKEEAEKEMDLYWYSIEGTNASISSNDITFLVKIIKDIIFKDFTKIERLTIYLKNIAKLCTLLNVAITWNLPQGLQVKQSYLDYKTSQIKLFSFSKNKLNITITDRNKLRESKQIIYLMPNLIHYLDATSMTILFNKFYLNYPNNNNFYSWLFCYN